MFQTYPEIEDTLKTEDYSNWNPALQEAAERMLALSDQCFSNVERVVNDKQKFSSFVKKNHHAEYSSKKEQIQYFQPLSQIIFVETDQLMDSLAIYRANQKEEMHNRITALVKVFRNKGLQSEKIRMAIRIKKMEELLGLTDTWFSAVAEAINNGTFDAFIEKVNGDDLATARKIIKDSGDLENDFSETKDFFRYLIDYKGLRKIKEKEEKLTKITGLIQKLQQKRLKSEKIRSALEKVNTHSNASTYAQAGEASGSAYPHDSHQQLAYRTAFSESTSSQDGNYNNLSKIPRASREKMLTLSDDLFKKVQKIIKTKIRRDFEKLVSKHNDSEYYRTKNEIPYIEYFQAYFEETTQLVHYLTTLKGIKDDRQFGAIHVKIQELIEKYKVRALQSEEVRDSLNQPESNNQMPYTANPYAFQSQGEPSRIAYPAQANTRTLQVAYQSRFSSTTASSGAITTNDGTDNALADRMADADIDDHSTVGDTTAPSGSSSRSYNSASTR